jgi:hypothetical protein
MPEESYTVPRLDPHQVRNERLKLASDMLALTLRDIALLPTKQQQVRLAMRALTDVQQWCKTHAAGAGN